MGGTVATMCGIFNIHKRLVQHAQVSHHSQSILIQPKQGVSCLGSGCVSHLVPADNDQSCRSDDWRHKADSLFSIGPLLLTYSTIYFSQNTAFIDIPTTPLDAKDGWEKNMCDILLDKHTRTQLPF